MLRFYQILVVLLFVAAPLHGQSMLTLDGSHRMRYMGWDEGLWGTDGSPVRCVLNRTRAGLTLRPVEGLELRAALLNEFTNWIEYPTERPFHLDEVVFEHLYARWRDTVGVPFELTVGRQDMKLGDGFLIMDGSPLDGSRSVYVNGARADLAVGDRQRLTLLYLHQPERDDLLPILNDKQRRLAEYERDILGASYAGQFDGTQLEANVLRGSGGHDVFVHTARQMILTIRTVTLGLLLRQELPWGLHASGEMATQFSEITDHTLPPVEAPHSSSGTALRAELAWAPPGDVPLAPRLSMSAYHYPINWEPVLGRWPMWNESIVFSRNIMVAPGYWKNLESLILALQIRPHPAFRAATSLQMLRHVGEGWEPGSGEASSIGRLATLHLFWRPDLPVSAHFMLERMWYDDSFVAGNGNRMQNSYVWFRAELLYTLPPVGLL